MSGRDVYKEVLASVEHPLFVIPLTSFIEQKCLVFSPGLDDCTEYRNIHQEYKNLVSSLFDGLVKDLCIPKETFLEVVNELTRDPAYPSTMYKGIEHISASMNFELFVQIMQKCNVDLQEQALLMILQFHGCDLMRELSRDSSSHGRGDFEDDENDTVLLMVLEQSKREYEESLRKGKATKPAISPEEAKQIRKDYKAESRQLEEEIKRMNLEVKEDFQRPASSRKRGESSRQEFQERQSRQRDWDEDDEDERRRRRPIEPPSYRRDTRMDEDDDDEDERRRRRPIEPPSQRRETGRSTGSRDPPASSSLMNAPDFEERQEFLREQRDKLLAMKQNERERMVRNLEAREGRDRPMSARNARKVVAQQATEQASQLEQGSGGDDASARSLAMRRAIAEKLKTEVVKR